jgi:protoheme ferro-lyase
MSQGDPVRLTLGSVVDPAKRTKARKPYQDRLRDAVRALDEEIAFDVENVSICWQVDLEELLDAFQEWVQKQTVMGDADEFE